MLPETFKVQRRKTLTNEVDGVWDALEDEEDTVIPRESRGLCLIVSRVWS
jgi:hypothetical protein